MDPKANTEEQVQLAQDIIDAPNEGERADAALRLAELVIALHEWRSAGGFDPYTAPRPMQPIGPHPEHTTTLDKLTKMQACENAALEAMRDGQYALAAVYWDQAAAFGDPASERRQRASARRCRNRAGSNA